MMRRTLQSLLSTALLAALAPACGGAVIDESKGTGDAGSDTLGSDASPDVPADTADCRPIPYNNMCSERVTYPCGLPIELSNPPSPTEEECKTLCAPITFSGPRPTMNCWVSAPIEGGIARTVGCASCAVGRRPADLLDDETPCEGEDPVASALAEMGRIEAASVHAFRRLERALSGLGADGETLARVRKAARDEIAHARRVSSLAKKRGGKPRKVRLDRDAAPTTFELALENAVEGCVHETLGVAYLLHQKEHAKEAELRELAAALYDDELDHAALSWDLVAFFDRHLDDEQRQAIAVARERALDDVVEEIGCIDPRVRDALGLPPPHVVAHMVNGLRATLFA